jgi:hypothetical protein
VYASSPPGLFKSANGGVTWRLVLKNYDDERVAVDPRNSGIVYAAGSGAGRLVKTTNGGRTWKRANAGLRVRDVQVIAVDPRRSATVYVGSRIGDGVFKSTNGGRSWHPANASLTRPRSVSAIAVDPRRNSTVYAGGQLGVFKSTNGGARWQLAYGRFGGSVHALVIDPRLATTLYAGTANGRLREQGCRCYLARTERRTPSVGRRGPRNRLDGTDPVCRDLRRRRVRLPGSGLAQRRVFRPTPAPRDRPAAQLPRFLVRHVQLADETLKHFDQFTATAPRSRTRIVPSLVADPHRAKHDRARCAISRERASIGSGRPLYDATAVPRPTSAVSARLRRATAACSAVATAGAQ